MKVLILSCNTGGGHNSCARAIGTELQRRGHTYETDDALLYVSKGTSRFVSNWHVRVCGLPHPAARVQAAARGHRAGRI